MPPALSVKCSSALLGLYQLADLRVFLIFWQNLHIDSIRGLRGDARSMAILRLGVVSSVSARAMAGACMPPDVGESRVLVQLPELRSLVTSIVYNASCLFQDLVLIESRYCKTKENHVLHVSRSLIWSRTAPYCLKISSWG